MLHTLKKPLYSPVLSLSIIFLFWKALLFMVAILSPGPGYDTSTNLLLHRSNDAEINNAWSRAMVKHITHKLVRWDAIYFVTASHRGYLYEQEYAFGMGYTKLVSLLTWRTRVFLFSMPFSGRQLTA